MHFTALERRGLVAVSGKTTADPQFAIRPPIVGAYFRSQRIFTEQRLLRTRITNALGVREDGGSGVEGSFTHSAGTDHDATEVIPICNLRGLTVKPTDSTVESEPELDTAPALPLTLREIEIAVLAGAYSNADIGETLRISRTPAFIESEWIAV